MNDISDLLRLNNNAIKDLIVLLGEDTADLEKLILMNEEMIAQYERKRTYTAHSCDIPGCAVCDPTYGL